MNPKTAEHHIAFAGGGTGGHLYPMLTLAMEFRRRIDCRLTFLTTDRPIDRDIIGATFGDDPAVEIVTLSVKPLPSRVGQVVPFIKAWRASVGLCRNRFATDPPDLIIGSGGFGSAPPIVAAGKRSIVTTLLNPDAVPGKANRFLARRVDVIYVQWPVTEQHLRSGRCVLAAGCPVRPEFASADREAGIARFNLDPNLKTLLVTGASQGARSINNVFIDNADRFAGCKGWQILHLAGQDGVEAVRTTYRKHNISAVVVAYSNDMPDALAAADLIVSRAGASTLAEIATANVPAILVPYPYHRDRHQYHNACVLEKADLARIVDDPVLDDRNGQKLIDTVVNLMADDFARIRMKQQDLTLSNRHASGMIVDDLLRRLAGNEARSLSSVAKRGNSESPPTDDVVAYTTLAGNHRHRRSEEVLLPDVRTL